MRLFRQIFIWKKLDADSAVRYCCFENLETKKVCVQNADFFSLPVDSLCLQQADNQIVELFLESSPDDRCEWFSNLSTAIEAHDLEFS